jgi:NitT/TauT family transport system ATP-binding protein
MSPRPGRIVATIDVPLPRPRHLEMMRTSVFFDCVNRVRDGLFERDAARPQPQPERIEGY